MPLGEFELINQYFRPAADKSDGVGVVLGIGDDAALIQPDASQQLVVAADTLVSGVHFPETAAPELIGERSLRVNISDMAAMGAEPAWYTLSLTLPAEWQEETRRDWVAGFSRGLRKASEAYTCVLVGGDTTSGPLNIAIQMLGQVPPGKALRRDGACVGDFVLVTHCLGDGAAALASFSETGIWSDTERDYLFERFYRPTARVREGVLLRDFATSAQDISDGLLADLGHICAASDVGAELDVDKLPISDATLAAGLERARQFALTGGDDYELVFTLSPEQMPEFAMAQARGDINACVVGRIVAGAGVHCLLDDKPYVVEVPGYRHF
ncbi:thiamine-phosphate kinase [Gilvimarinus sp. DA14]|uniref:thiamine-phosphate kinase n=1 Tax=Gilvimarinus sp. DA14 TaxID=2956798 RepID=UPI0020B70D49|nr:thiamine-phosphate kinase [Gilvimarinus sp. DA14]UTF59699.1 thiamine-phosphate kinase [Gilvimarinus sp. DA14]